METELMQAAVSMSNNKLRYQIMQEFQMLTPMSFITCCTIAQFLCVKYFTSLPQRVHTVDPCQ